MSRENLPTRTRILEATLKLLEDGEGSKVRMSDIAKAANVSRQAVYLHFPGRADLLTETTRYVDQINDIDALLQESRNASTGRERLVAWVDVWGNYIPKIYGVAKALLAMKDTDDEALTAWNDRMNAVREGCEAVITALQKDGALNPTLTEKEATDMLWTVLSVRSWEHLRQDCGWSQETYIEKTTIVLERALVA